MMRERLQSMSRLLGRIRPAWFALVLALGLAPVGAGLLEADLFNGGAEVAGTDAELHATAATSPSDRGMGVECTMAIDCSGSHCTVCAALVTPVNGHVPAGAASHALDASSSRQDRPPEPRFRPPIRST